MTKRRNNKTNNNKKQKLTIMKKIFLVALAAVGLAACATEDTIVTPQGQAIAFGDAFVDNSTKVIYEGNNKVEGFYVWGVVNDNVPIYAGAQVARNSKEYGAAWDFVGEVPARYWTPSCTYKFAAIANGNAKTVVNGLPTEISYTLNATDPADLIYGVVSAETNESGTPIEGVNTNGVVAFTMNHLLAKMYFTVTDNMGADYTVTPTSIKVTKAEKSGTYAVGTTATNGTWTPGGDKTAELEFVNGAQLIIPVAQELKVEITYDIEFGGTKISTGAKKTGTIASTSYAANTVYHITATIGATAIQFSIDSVSGFGTPEQGGSVTIQ